MNDPTNRVDTIRSEASGWRRLWIVLSGTLFVVFSVFTIWKLPIATDVSHSRIYVSLSAENQAKFDAANAIPEFETSARIIMSNGYEVKIREMPNEMSTKYEFPWMMAYQETVKEKLYEDRFKFVKQICMIWLVTCIVVYAFGIGVGWVRRGFTTKP